MGKDSFDDTENSLRRRSEGVSSKEVDTHRVRSKKSSKSKKRFSAPKRLTGDKKKGLLRENLPDSISTEKLKLSSDGCTVLSGTIEQLLALMLYNYQKVNIKEHQKQIIFIYPTIIHHKTLLSYLSRTYSTASNVVKKRVIDIVTLVVTLHSKRFSDTYPDGIQLRDLIIDFVTANCSDKLFGADILRILTFLNETVEKSPVPPENDEVLSELSPRQFAKQLCVIEMRLFKDIPLCDVLEKFNKGKSKAFNHCSDWFEKLSSYVISCILLTGDKNGRSALLNRFIDVAKKMLRNEKFRICNEFIFRFSKSWNSKVKAIVEW